MSSDKKDGLKTVRAVPYEVTSTRTSCLRVDAEARGTAKPAAASYRSDLPQGPDRVCVARGGSSFFFDVGGFRDWLAMLNAFDKELKRRGVR